jgi:hypothetical protein
MLIILCEYPRRNLASSVIHELWIEPFLGRRLPHRTSRCMRIALMGITMRVGGVCTVQPPRRAPISTTPWGGGGTCTASRRSGPFPCCGSFSGTTGRASECVQSESSFLGGMNSSHSSTPDYHGPWGIASTSTLRRLPPYRPACLTTVQDG